MPDCRLCGAAAPEILLDFGPQPLSNHYPTDAAQPEATFGMSLKLCGRCGVTQLGEVPPLASLEDHPAWITYREAEHHLDQVASLLAGLQPLAGLKVRGLSFKDEPLIARLRQAGASDARCYAAAELGGGGIESIQGRLDPERAERLVSADGGCDLLLARHILEHAQNLPGFLAALRRLLKPSGLLLLELPDSARSLAQKDYSMPWEEHVFYFTPETLAQVWRCCGWEPVASARFAYQPEDVLVTVLAPAGVTAPIPAPAAISLARNYAAGLAATAAAYRETLRHHRHSRGPVALLGGGHLGCTFVNLLGLADCIDCVIDDDPNKQGLLMPGSRLPILPSSALAARGVKLCLLSINPDSEARVIARFRALAEQGLVFASIFPASPYKLELEYRGLA